MGLPAELGHVRRGFVAGEPYDNPYETLAIPAPARNRAPRFSTEGRGGSVRVCGAGSCVDLRGSASPAWDDFPYEIRRFHADIPPRTEPRVASVSVRRSRTSSLLTLACVAG